jgi:hypothetical protein
MAEKLKRKRDWEGRYVKLLREFESQGGNIFPVGTVMRVDRNFGGLHLSRVACCERCRHLHRDRIKGISEYAVELLPADYSPDSLPAT